MRRLIIRSGIVFSGFASLIRMPEPVANVAAPEPSYAYRMCRGVGGGRALRRYRVIEVMLVDFCLIRDSVLVLLFCAF